MRALLRGRTLLPVILALGLVLLQHAAPALAVTVSVSPGFTSITNGSTFSVDVNTTAFSDLKAYELVLTYDPNLLQLLGATPGGVLTGTGNPFSSFLVNDYAPPPDSVWYDAAMLTGSTAGPGTLVHLTFKALHVGTATLTWQRADFRNSGNYKTSPTTVNGQVQISALTPGPVTTWSMIRRLYTPRAEAAVVPGAIEPGK